MGFFDLHIHSMYSLDGTASIPAILKYASSYTDLNVLAITDHDSMVGVPEALELAPRYNLQVIPGCEVSSRDGHVLCLFLEHLIPPGLSLLETVLRTGDQGGLCIAAHPMAKGVKSLRFSTICEVLNNEMAAKILIGIETINGGLIYTRRNPLVEKEAQSLPLAQTGGSDAHILRMIAQGSTWFEGNTIKDLRTALLNRSTLPRQGYGLTTTTVVTSYIPTLFLRLLGWVKWNAAPEAPIRFASRAKIRAFSAVTGFSGS